MILPDLMSNTNFTVRIANADDVHAIARVHVDTWKTAYVGLMPQSLLDSLSYEDRAKQYGKSLEDPVIRRRWIVAENGSKIVGFVCGWKSRDNDPVYDSELYAIYVLQEHAGSGIGRALVLPFAKQLMSEGFKKMKLWVLEANPSRKFYEAIGGVLLEQVKVDNFNGVDLREVAYGYDLNELIQRLEAKR